VGSYPQLRSFPCHGDDHVNNHLFIGDHPPTIVNTLLCQVEATPHKSEGIEPFHHSQTLCCVKVGVTHCKSEGIEPFTTVNTPPCQVEVTLAIGRYQALQHGPTLRHAKSKPCLRTQSTLRRVTSWMHPHLLFSTLSQFVLCTTCKSPSFLACH